MKEQLQRWRSYRATMRELQAYSDRELSDLGLARANIPPIAFDPAIGGWRYERSA